MFNKSFQIDGIEVGEGCKPYIIAEMSANHGNDINIAINIIKEAKKAGADAVKIQTYTADTLTLDCQTPDFEAKGAWKGQYLYDLYVDASMPWEWTPKPLLQVGSKPILETIITNFAKHGFINITLSVNYKAEMIKEYFGDGSNFGVNIDYIEETKRLGTAGALSLIQNKPTEPFFVMNADLLTDVNFSHLLDFHSFGNSTATMCVREYDFQVPYGVIETNDGNITSIVEKPMHKFFVNAGIYVLSPKVFNYIPNNEFYDMPTLFNTLIKKEETTISFPIHEYWLDIGRIEEFEKANNEYDKVF